MSPSYLMALLSHWAHGSVGRGFRRLYLNTKPTSRICTFSLCPPLPQAGPYTSALGSTPSSCLLKGMPLVAVPSFSRINNFLFWMDHSYQDGKYYSIILPVLKKNQSLNESVLGLYSPLQLPPRPPPHFSALLYFYSLHYKSNSHYLKN